MSQELMIASILNGLTNGFTKGMELRQQKEALAQKQEYQNRELEIRSKEAENLTDFRKAQLSTGLEKAYITEDMAKEKNDLTERLAKANNDTKKDIADLVNGTRTDIANMNNETKKLISDFGATLQKMKDDAAQKRVETTTGSQEKIATGKNETQKEVQGMKGETAVKVQGMKNKSNGIPLNKAQEAADKEFAVSYSKYLRTGKQEIDKNINQLINVKEKLKTGVATPGFIFGMANSPLGKFVNAPALMPETKMAMQQVHDTALQALQQLKGSLSDADRDFITGLAFDPSLPASKNSEKIDNAIKYIREQQSAWESMGKEYKTKGSIKEYTGQSSSEQQKPLTGSLYPSNIEAGITAVMKAKGWTRDQAVTQLKRAKKL
jgi:hypothetical protein